MAEYIKFAIAIKISNCIKITCTFFLCGRLNENHMAISQEKHICNIKERYWGVLNSGFLNWLVQTN